MIDVSELDGVAAGMAHLGDVVHEAYEAAVIRSYAADGFLASWLGDADGDGSWEFISRTADGWILTTSMFAATAKKTTEMEVLAFEGPGPVLARHRERIAGRALEPVPSTLVGAARWMDDYLQLDDARQPGLLRALLGRLFA
ncbi:MAG: hypothetical protein GY913_07390 [Proteobacteria bacterium]|nr:hypothetical protein [Pseudomonadota bacterium]MCP4916733.1 hypothetical protein [Pseudomonadota bacterium]